MTEEQCALHPHESAQDLLEAVLAGLPDAFGWPQLFPVVVPSVAFRDWLQLRIARRRGICMGFEFLTPQDFLRRVPGPVVPGRESPWAARALQWKILTRMSDVIGPLGMFDPAPRDLLALAGVLADRFDQYGHFRPDLIRSWARGESGLPSGVSSADRAQETWQRALWTAIAADTEVPHPAVELLQWIRDTDSHEALKRDFPEVMVLGSGSLDPLLLEVLSMMKAAGCAVTVHMLLPSLGFLGDLKVRRGQSALLVADTQDPQELEVGASHPLLESMGRQSVGTFLLLGQLDDQYTHWPEPNEKSVGSSGLLKCLQEDIRCLRPPGSASPSDAASPPMVSASRRDVAIHHPQFSGLLPPSGEQEDGHEMADDGSLRVHSCFGPRREVEVLREEILRAFEELPDLHPDEIHVVTSSLETYAPLVAAVLEQGGRPLPVRITEVHGLGREPTVEAILLLLRLVHRGRFTASELLGLCGLPSVQDALGIRDDSRAADRIRAWVTESGFMHGLREDDSAGHPKIGTWRFARDRILAGRWFGPETEDRYPNGDYVLPVADALASDEPLAGRWTSWCACLEETLLVWCDPADAATWARRIGQACDDLLSGEEDARFTLREPLGFLAASECSVLLDAGAVMDWLDGEVGEPGRRSVLSGHITFGGIKPLQNLPCRVLAMVGMQEGVFPRQAQVPAWDLLQCDPRVWDRNPRVEDRQLFLDAVLTPSDRLILCASNRNVRTGRDEGFSSCVDELLRTLARMGVRRESLVVTHPLQPFSPFYFAEASGRPSRTPSHDPHQARVGTALLDSEARKSGLPLFVPHGKSVGEKDSSTPVKISLHEMIDFWRDPARAFLRAAGIVLQRETEEDVALDRSPLTMGGLERWSLKNTILEALPTASTPEWIRAKLEADRDLPPAGIGEAHWKEGLSTGMALVAALQDLRGEDLMIETTVSSRSATVSGQLALTCEGTRLLDFRVGQFKDSKHFLAPWIRAIVASASGQPLEVLLLDEANPDDPTVCPALAESEARSLLESLVQGYLEGLRRPLAFAPATSDAYARAAMGKNPDSALEKAEVEWSRSSTEFGDGEGQLAAARLAWRDRDAFEESEDWVRWGDGIARPLRQWFCQAAPLSTSHSQKTQPAP